MSRTVACTAVALWPVLADARRRTPSVGFDATDKAVIIPATVEPWRDYTALCVDVRDRREALVTDEGAWRLSDGVMVSIVTGAAYATAYAYEVGSARAFGIPIGLIDMQLMPSLFATVVSLGALLFVFVQSADALSALVIPKTDEHPVITALRVPFILVVLAYGFWLVGGAAVFSRRDWLVFAAAMVAWALLRLTPGLLFRQLRIGYKEKLRAWHQFDVALQGPLNRLLFGSLGSLTVVLVLSGVFVLLGLTGGYAQSKRQDVFFITNQKPETVVLKIYGDRVITAEFRRQEKKIGRLYQVLKIDAAGLTLRQERIGPLSLDD